MSVFLNSTIVEAAQRMAAPVERTCPEPERHDEYVAFYGDCPWPQCKR